MSYAPISDFGDKPALEYPLTWNYRLIGAVEEHLRAALVAVLGSRDHRVKPGNRSANGRYCSIELELTVESDADRHALFELLRAQSAVVYVL